MTRKAAGRVTTRSLSKLSLLSFAVALLAVAGCGSSSKSTTSTEASTPATTPTTSSSTTASTPASTPASSASGSQSIEADPSGQLKFNKTSLTAKAGKATFNFTNKAPIGHNFTIASSSGAVVGATPTFEGGSKTLSVTLKPGTYKFYCSVPGHRQAGMEGTLTVQ